MATKSSRCYRPATCLAVIAGCLLGGTSCTTTYDYYGRPRQTVDPGVAVAGVAAAGILGYALAKDNRHHHRPTPVYCAPAPRPHHGHGGGYYGYGGGYSNYNGCDTY